MLLAAGGLEANTLWNNGGLASSTYVPQVTNGSGGNPCDSSCTGGPFTIFDNFNLGVSNPGAVSLTVTGFDFSDFLVTATGGAPSVPGSQSVQWSIWSGDPLAGGLQGKQVAGGTALAVLSPIGVSACSGGTCLELYTVTLGASVTLSASQTYYLGTSVVQGTNNYLTYRATTNDTNPGQAAYQGWEQSNGSSSGTVGSTWAPKGSGGINLSFPNSSSGVSATDSAFEILGNVSTPEPGTWTLMGIAIAGLCLVRRRRTA